ncbi:sm_term_P27, putative phage terminase, small subunit, P27 family [uncultured Caudovirales phage]|uniref:Sm_term_P27, putative phage terminase, small subunit, P27 family n=1 Tax=uncultured Caudovirales phage TaxID=2100421 RepID=A0A6J5N622_9CAUD|nr:sm_term_P27, putative phage terminase, small subunit, P27 family [uncultured Caudovirales phage]
MATTGRPMGRPAKPVEAQRALGNPGHKPLPAAPMPGQGIEGLSGIPTPPMTLLEPGIELWNHTWEAGRQWLAPAADRTTITLLCEAFDEYSEIRKAFATGLAERTYVTSNGSIVTHPYIGQMKELRVQMTAWLSSLGFSPADRARLGLSEVRVRDELDDLQRRRQERASATG